jgi:uncharacterized protein (DUF4415 family)
MYFQFDPTKAKSNLNMKAEYDFSKGKRGAILPGKGKTRITIYIDDTILEEFRARAETAGTGYQTMINDALKEYLSKNSEKPVTESTLRRILQEEFPKIGQPTDPSS